MTKFSLDEKEILRGEGKLKFGFHPVYFLRTLFSVNQFNDSNIKKILRELALNHSKIQTRQSGIDVGKILNFIKDTQNVPGDILELGTWLGGFTYLMAKYLDLIDSNKHIITCDSFEGMPKTVTKGRKETEGLLRADFNFVKEKFKKFAVDDRITTVKGFIQKTLPTMNEKSFSFVFVDTAAYDSMKFALEFIYPKVNKNGIIAVDDYTVTNKEFGQAEAVDEFCKKYNLQLNMNPFAHFKK